MVITDVDYRDIYEHFDELFSRSLFNNKVNTCPYCDGNNIIRYGNYKHGQRYMCKICGRTFCNRTATPFYCSKKNPSTWIKYIELMLQNNTLKECSEKLCINIGTAFYWRHKILCALMEFRKVNKLENYVEMSRLLIKESYKGSRNAPKEERKILWNIIAADNNEKILACPLCKSRWDLKAFNKKVYSKIDKESLVIARGDRFLWAIERKHNEGKKVVIDEENILKVYFREIKKSMRRYYGVATKYLTHYLYFITIFCVKKTYKSLDLLYKLINLRTYNKNNDFRNLILQV